MKKLLFIIILLVMIFTLSHTVTPDADGTTKMWNVK